MLLLNGQPIEYFTFPGGEIQVKLPKEIIPERIVLKWKPTNAGDIMLLMLTVDALKRAHIYDDYPLEDYKIDIDLDVLYLPYARQDRVCASGEAFSLSVICNLLESLKLTTIRLWDVHNAELTLKLFEDTFVYHTQAVDIFSRFKIFDKLDTSNLILCAPDKGAEDRVMEIVVRFKLRFPVRLVKERCPDSGKILGIDYATVNPDWHEYNVMVIDDICDGGATFIEAAKLLREKGAEKLYLYITHGIFSKGLDELLKWYEHIYCHHVLDDSKYKSDSKLTILQGI